MLNKFTKIRLWSKVWRTIRVGLGNMSILNRSLVVEFFCKASRMFELKQLHPLVDHHPSLDKIIKVGH